METLSPHPAQALSAPLLPPTLPRQFSLGLAHSRPLDDVLDSIQDDDRGKWDSLASRQDLFLQGGRVLLPHDYEDDCPTTLTPTSWANSQLCTRLGIPAGYFRKCPPHLQDEQFNWWIKQTRARGDESSEGEEEDTCPDCAALQTVSESSVTAARAETWLLRGKGNRLRGVLSERYAKLDNAQLLHTLTPLLESRMEVKGFVLTDESLHLRLVDPNLSREVLPDDRLFVGLHVSNSEVGLRAVTIDALVYRLVCTNGLVKLVRGKSLFRQRHVSWNTPRFEEALRVAMGEAVTVAAGLLEQLSWATRTPVADVEGVLSSIAAQWSLTEAMQQRVKQALLVTAPAQQETVYGLVNAYTLAAQSLPADERYHLEVLAGRLVDQGLPKAAPVRHQQEPVRQ